MGIFKKTPLVFSFLSMCLLTLSFCSATEDPSDDDETIKKIVKNVRQALHFLHYAPQDINDEFSESVFNNYIEFLDPTKRYLLQSDVDYFKNDLYKLDEYFNEEELTFYHSTVDTIYKRIEESRLITEEILEKPFQFNGDDFLITDHEKRKYASNKQELKKLWHNYLKYNVLTEILDLEEDSTNIDKSFVELEKEAREQVKDYTSDFFRRFKKRKKMNYLSGYINSFTSVYDPHTQYFSPRDHDDFEQSISGQLQGIGARLRDDKGYATITELIVGGPAWKSEQLEVDDKIIKVQQGEDGEPVNIVGMLLEESIELIKGKKGTTVVLTVKKKNGEQKKITLERDIIEIAETYAKSAVIKDENGDKYGLVHLPGFYINFNDRENGRDASEDVAKEIEELKKQNIKGLIFDLRNNGGGSLSEVVEIVGLFIDHGPVVQVKDKDGELRVHEDKDRGTIYDGNLVVLVNGFSASASEIMAAALQDYQRAIVIGSNKTYGKGTVQSVYPISRFSREDLGALKLTIQKYYRINGGSTQKNGVTSDIILPESVSYEEYSESAQENALEWDKIRKAKYRPLELFNYNKLVQVSNSRLEKDGTIKLIKESSSYWDKLNEEEKITLNYEKLKALMEKRNKEVEQFDALKDFENNLSFMSPSAELEQIKNDSVLGIKRENWHDNLSHDFTLKESINVLNDMQKSRQLIAQKN